MGITVIRVSCCQPRRHLPESAGHDCDGERRCSSGRNTLCGPRSAPMLLFAAARAMQTHCLHRQHCCFCCTTLVHSRSGRGPRATSHSGAMSSAGTRTTAASSNVYFGCRTQLLQQQQQYPSNSFCFTIVGVGHRQQRSICWLGFNYTTISGFAQRNHCPDSSGYSYTRKQQNPQKTCRGS